MSTGRVTQAYGLSDANGSGVAATLRELATGGPEVQNKGVVSFEEAATTPGGPFVAPHVKAPIGDGRWLTQCNESGNGERVWQTEGKGPDVESRWATARYPQSITASCGEMGDGTYSIVVRSSSAGSLGARYNEHNGDCE